jgi:hypothetical protein
MEMDMEARLVDITRTFVARLLVVVIAIVLLPETLFKGQVVAVPSLLL